MIIEGINSHLNNLDIKLKIDLKATFFFGLKHLFRNSFFVVC